MAEVGTAAVASWVEIDGDAFAHNTSVLRGMLLPGCRLGGVIKGDAYGHGLRVCLPVLHPLLDVIHVVTAQDALWIRAWERAHDVAPRPILVIGVLSPDEVVTCAREDVAVVVADAGFAAHARAAQAAGVTVGVHVHLDTGLSREGFLPEDLEAGLAWLDGVGGAVRVDGVMMHFANVEDVTEQAWARQQLERFLEGERVLRALLSAAGRPATLVRHTAASAAAMVLAPSHGDVVRAGISLYGLWPSRETRIGVRLVHGTVPSLRPALAWRVPIQAVKSVPVGTPVGYGCTWVAARPTQLAVLPVGYFDGYPRALSNQGHVLVAGARCPVVGRVMMNHLVVDVTDAPAVGPGDVATLVGRDGAEAISADALATRAGTIHYELVTRIAAHVPRILLPPSGTAGDGGAGHGPEGST